MIETINVILELVKTMSPIIFIILITILILQALFLRLQRKIMHREIERLSKERDALMHYLANTDSTDDLHPKDMRKKNVSN